MALHRISRGQYDVLAAAPLVAFAAALLCSTAVGFASTGATAGAVVDAGTFGGAVPAEQPETAHPIWRVPASHTGLRLHRIECSG